MAKVKQESQAFLCANCDHHVKHHPPEYYEVCRMCACAQFKWRPIPSEAN